MGIGKSLGYLIPGVIISRITNKPLIVTSSTIQLTEQLSNDIKKVENIINIDIECIIVFVGPTVISKSLKIKKKGMPFSFFYL